MHRAVLRGSCTVHTRRSVRVRSDFGVSMSDDEGGFGGGDDGCATSHMQLLQYSM